MRKTIKRTQLRLFYVTKQQRIKLRFNFERGWRAEFAAAPAAAALWTIIGRTSRDDFIYGNPLPERRTVIQRLQWNSDESTLVILQLNSSLVDEVSLH